jgi:glycosyltransferase involved in cell wall biosynthesis
VKVIQVVPDIADVEGGPAYTVPRLSESLGRLGAQVQLHVLTSSIPVARSYQIHAHGNWRFPNKLGISPKMRYALRQEAKGAEVIHNNGLWKMPNVYSAWAARGRLCRLVYSPRGMLSPWALRCFAWKKKLMWWLCQGRAVRDAHCFHATAENEYQEIRAAGLRGPVAVIPNGIDIGAESANPSANGLRRLLFFGRLHPVKGIDLLLRAWQQIENRFPDWELHIAGVSDPPGYQEQMEQLAGSLGIRRVCFPGPAFGPDKTRQFQQAELFVLPSHSENFGVAVAEALAHGVPAIVTKGAPWSGLETHECGWWIEQGVDSLADCLRSALALSPEKLRDKGRRGRQWMEQEFSWDRVGRMMLETYRWLLGGGAPPAWVHRN